MSGDVKKLPAEHEVKINEAVILAGGLGTRLRSEVSDLPKCLAPVAGKPFLSYVIDMLRMQGIERFIFSLGYLSEKIEEFLQAQYPTLDYTTVIEKEPLGTGGAIRLALSKAREKHVLVANGDTLFRVDLKRVLSTHLQNNSECTLALKPMLDFDRYGVVGINEEGRIISFLEKKHYSKGLINGGIYLLDREKFMARNFPEKFSFEKDYCEQYYGSAGFYGSIQEGYFIDIGIPEDFKKAGTDLAQKPLSIPSVDKSWTLFLDRDGVINVERLGEYVLNWKEFIFSEGVLSIFRKLSETFGRVIIVTNQRGITKGLMTEQDLLEIHREMIREVESAGGRVDRIYYCMDRENTSFNRKPNPGMAYEALIDFPDIDPAKSIMVGNKPSDMRFGRSAGFHTVFVTTTNPDQEFPHPDIDLVFPHLAAFASALES
jgi:D-glycero-alpha-D-manno-heptose 1-phosphate guanylyltransferase